MSRKIFKNQSLLLLMLIIPSICLSQDWMEITGKAVKPNQEKDSVFYYLEESYNVAIKNENIEHKLYSLKLLNIKSNEFFDLNRMKKYAVQYSNEIRNIDKQKLKPRYINTKYVNFIAYYLNIADIDKSKKYIDSLHLNLNQTPVEKMGFFDFQDEHVANIYTIEILEIQGQYQKAIQLLKKYLIEIDEDNKNNLRLRNIYKFSYLQALANFYSKLNQNTEAIAINKELLVISTDWINYRERRSEVQINLAENYLLSGQLIQAEKQLKIIESTPTQFPMIEMNLKKIKVNLAIKQNDFINAQLYSEELIKSMIYLNEKALHDNILIEENNLAQISESLNNPLIASSIYTKTYVTIKGKNLDNSFKDRLILIGAIQGILRTKELITPKETKILISELITTVDQLQLLYNTSQDKQFLIDKTYPALQLAFDKIATLNEKEPSEELIELAFLISEKTKSISLRESQLNLEADEIKDVPKEILEKEKVLRATVKHYNTKQGEDFTDRTFSDSLFVAVNRFTAFQKTLEIDYPKYYNYKYSNRVLSLKEAQDKIAIDRIAVSYFNSTNALYAIIIDKEKSILKKINWTDQDEEDVINFTNQVAANQFNTTLSQRLYKQLIKNLFPDDVPARLLIVPDGALNYLNFELLKNQEKWLLNDAAISYDESVTLALTKAGNQSNDQSTFVGFAPFYAKSDTIVTRAALYPLSYSKKELETVSNYYSGDYFVGEQGSLARFRESVNGTKSDRNTIFHIASHAEVNKEEPGKSFILFNNGTSEKLHAEDIFQLNMQDSFVVLSACETGTGALKTGQGMRSFSQAFRYAGATSLLHSKWKVSDLSTSIIMSSFYEELATGVTKDLALQKAKIDYLENAPDAQSKTPYYWAGFVLTGDVAAMPQSNFNLIIWIAIIFLTSVILIILWRKKYN